METLVYTVNEVAEQLRVGRTTAYGLISSRTLSSIKVGGSRRVTAEALRAYIAGLSS